MYYCCGLRLAGSLRARSCALRSPERQSILHFEWRLLPESGKLGTPSLWLWRTTLQVAAPAQLLEEAMSYRKRCAWRRWWRVVVLGRWV